MIPVLVDSNFVQLKIKMKQLDAEVSTPANDSIRLATSQDWLKDLQLADSQHAAPEIKMPKNLANLQPETRNQFATALLSSDFWYGDRQMESDA